jgi:Ca2+-binding EF-hand superfamily protein
MVTTRFSDTQWNQIVEAWRIFDTDSDGLVGVNDLRTLLLSFGYDHSEKVKLRNTY